MVEFAPKVRQQVHALCARYGVARLELTGSAARDDFDPATSDVDFLVEFLPNAKVSAFEGTRRRTLSMNINVRGSSSFSRCLRR